MKTLKIGCQGEDVKILQRALHLLPDGIFGPITEESVKAHQKKYGLTADGIVGEKTWATLGIKEAAEGKSIDASVIYAPLKCCITRSPNRRIRYLAIHYTAGWSSAPGRAKSMKAGWEQRKKSSADFGVDDRDMVQFNPDLRNYYCWSVGDKKQGNVSCPDANNRNTISIEICSTLAKGASVEKPNHDGWSFTEASLNNAARLAKMLMRKYEIPIGRVVRHYDISGKVCPGIVGWNDSRLYTMDGKATTLKNDSAKWEEFKKSLTK